MSRRSNDRSKEFDDEQNNDLFSQFSDDPLFLKQIADSGPAITYVLDLETCDFIYININANDLSGRDKSYFFMQGKNIFRELIHPWDYERAMQYVYLLSKEDRNLEVLEARLKIKDDSYRWFRFNDHIFKRDEQGRPLRSIGVAHDIHETILATQESQKLNNWFNSVLENSPNGITALRAIRDKRGSIIDLEYIFANRIAVAAKKRGELEGTVFSKDLPSLKQVSLFEHYVRVIETGIPWAGEVLFKDDDLDVDSWLLVSVSKLDDGCIASFFDVTERKRIEQQIIKQEAQFHSLVENTPDVISRWNKELKLIYANSAAEVKTGVSRESLYGKTSSEMGQADEIAYPWMEKLRVVFETGRPETAYQVFPSPDGLHHFFARMVPERNEQGQVETVLAIARDITEMRKAESALRESTELLNGIMNAPNVGIAVFKVVRNKNEEIENFQCEFVNRRTMEALPGINQLGMMLTDFGKDGIDQLDHFREVMETGKRNTYTLKAESVGVDGWFLISNAPLGTDRLVQVWEDITEIKNAEQELVELKDELARRATDKYQALFNSIDEGFCIIEKVDGDGPLDFRFVEVNPAFGVHIGTVEIVGKTIREAFPKESEEWYEIYNSIVETGKDVRFERAMDSQEKILELYAFRINDETLNRVAIVFRDITERKKAERQVLSLKDELAQRATDKYLSIFNSIDEGFHLVEVIFDKNDNSRVVDLAILEENPAAQKIFGESLAGRTIKEAHPEYDESRMQAWGEVVRTGKRVRLTRYSDIFKKWFEFSLTKVRYKDSNQVASVFLDITERKKAEESLRVSEERLAADLADTKLLQSISRQLIEENNVEKIYEQLLNAATAIMRSDIATMQLLFPEKNELLLLAVKGIDPEATKCWQWVKKGGQSSCGAALQGGKRVFIRDVEDSELIWGKENLQCHQRAGIRTAQSTPLITRSGKLIGMISTHWRTIHDPSEREFDLLDVLARQAADLLERRQGEERYLSQLQQEVQERTAELKESKDLLQSIANTLPDMISVQAYPSREILYHNQAAFYMNGFDVDAMKKMTVEERHALIHPDDLEGLRTYIAALANLSDDDVSTFEYRSKHLTNDWVWCRVRTKVLERDEAQNVKSIVNIIQNITAQKQAEEELQRKNDLLQSVINSSLGTIRVMQSVRDDRGEIIDFRYIMANNALGTSYKVSDRKGKLLSEVHPDWMKSEMFERFKMVVETGNRADFETYYNDENFNTWFHVVAVKLEDGFVATSEDITERKKAEQLA
ncbi:MAG TPA: PAS domain S-box protein [Chitinophagaceae bacterium]|nr:PAS domain S-box protein [Chitinophagaceae bacterium]